jgi:hypothetical protein
MMLGNAQLAPDYLKIAEIKAIRCLFLQQWKLSTESPLAFAAQLLLQQIDRDET